jgi:hypothetical protein
MCVVLNAQTTAPAPAEGVAVANRSWVIGLVLVAAATIWFYMRRRGRPPRK